MTNENEQLSLTKVDALNTVSQKIAALQKDQKIVMPQNYSAENAINSAWLLLQDTKDKNSNLALEVCTKNSIIESLYNMVLQGLSPAKKQCYFIVRGKQLCMDKSYFGAQVAAKRLNGVKDVVANVIYQDDVFEYGIDPETGYKKIYKHEQSLENIDTTKIKGVYAYIIKEDGQNDLEVMSMAQVKASWNMGAMKGGSGAHKNFSDQMALKTVINRLCKRYVNTADDSDLLAEAFNSDEKTYDEDKIIDNVQAEVKQEIEEKANKKTLDIQEDTNEKEPVIDVEVNKPKVSNENKNVHHGTEQTEIGLEF